MPAQKRSHTEIPTDEYEDPSAATQQHFHHHANESRRREGDGDGDGSGEKEEDEQQREDKVDEDDHVKEVKRKEDQYEDEDYEDSLPSDSREIPEHVYVDLPEVRRIVQCPICLGIIKKTRTVMDCLHRFCRDCIDKSLRLGNNECPACRKHCASRRSLRDDPNFDNLIATLYPDIDKYEEEELAFHEDERTHNKQIQASIAPNKWNCKSPEASEDHEDENHDNRDKDSSSAGERCTEDKLGRHKRRVITRTLQPSSAVANNDGNCSENDSEACRKSRGLSLGLALNLELLPWGRGGARSHTRYGNATSGKNLRSTRLNKLVDYLRNLEENNDDEPDVRLKLVSLDKQSTPTLQQPYLCCRPSLSVKQLREYVALQMHLHAEDIDMLVVETQNDAIDNQSIARSSTLTGEHHILDNQQTLAALKVTCSSNGDHLIVAYQQKQTK